MTPNDQVDTILGAWFDEGPMDLPDVTRRAILTAVPTTRQARRGLFAPGRFFQMPALYRAAAVIAIAVVALGGAAFLIGQGQSGPGDHQPTPTTAPSLSPTAGPTSSAEPSIAISTPSPLDGHTPTFVVPFAYRLPAGEGLVVDDGDPTWYQFRHPNPNGQGYDKGIVVRTIDGGREDPCDPNSAAMPMADPQAFVEYFRTVPTMQLRDEGTFSVDGHPGIEVSVAWSDPTPECPNVWLWPVEESITDLGGRTTSRLSIAAIDGTYVLFNTFPADFAPSSDEFISSIRFDGPESSRSLAP
jgi:hypothetical protein